MNKITKTQDNGGQSQKPCQLITPSMRHQIDAIVSNPILNRINDEWLHRFIHDDPIMNVPPFVSFPWAPKPKRVFVESDVSIWNYLFIIAALIYVVLLAM